MDRRVSSSYHMKGKDVHISCINDTTFLDFIASLLESESPFLSLVITSRSQKSNARQSRA